MVLNIVACHDRKLEPVLEKKQNTWFILFVHLILVELMFHLLYTFPLPYIIVKAYTYVSSEFKLHVSYEYVLGCIFLKSYDIRILIVNFFAVTNAKTTLI